MTDLKRQLKDLKALTRNLVSGYTVSEMDDLADKLEKEILYVVVVGLFKRGKSTVINALLGKPLSPVAVTPVTAIVTLFEYGDPPGATICFEDGRTETVPLTDIEEYVSEKQNPENEKRVTLVRVRDRIDLLKRLSIVDTPGLGSVFQHNSTATMAFLPKIDAAVYVMSADIPVSQTDAEFIRELVQKVPKIVFVLNKSDLLGEAELEEILQHNTSVIRKILNAPSGQPDILPVSGKFPDQESSNMDRLTRSILDIGELEKTRLLELSVSRRIQALYNQARTELQFRLENLLAPLHTLEEKQEKISRSISLMKEQKEEFGQLITGKVNKLQQEIQESASAASHQLKSMIGHRIQAAFGESHSLPDDEELLNLQESLNQLIIGRFEELKTSLENSTRDQFRSILKYYSDKSESFLHELSENLASFSGFGLDRVSDQFNLDVYTSFYLTLDGGGSGTFRLNRSGFGFLTGYYKRKVKARMITHYQTILIRNTSSLIYDLQYKIQESFRKFNAALNDRLMEVMSGMEKIVTETIAVRKQEQAGVQAEVDKLKTLIDAVQLKSDPEINYRETLDYPQHKPFIL